MERLNEQTSIIFSRLITLMEAEVTKRIQSANGRWIRISDYETSIDTESGIGYLYTIDKYHDQEPATSIKETMAFIVVDNRMLAEDFHLLIIIPQRYENFESNQYQESTSIRNGTIRSQIPELLDTHILLAQDWLTEFQAQGFLV